MNHYLTRRILPAMICLLGSLAIVAAQTPGDTQVLTNAAVVKLVKAGFKDKSLVTIIASRPVHFDLTPDRMIELKRSGVSEKVILAMIARQEGTEISDEAWSDDEFFSSPMSQSQGTQGTQGTPSTAKPGNSNDGSSVDIFGSSGGSQGSTKSRGGNGSSSGDWMTTGSATVKILRPPTEGGGAASTKLEKTPSLNNDSVIELVEAGFSEGTIIRRIEQSPVNFDFAPEKLSELKKHRVSEKVVGAMKTAMGVDNENTNKPSSPSSNVTPKQ